MWFVIFVVGVAVVIYRGVREPVWAAMGAGYVYFAIPHLEFKAPAMPYQAAFWAMAVAGSFRFYVSSKRRAERQLETLAIDVARKAVEAARGPMKEALATAALHGRLPGELRVAALEAGEGPSVARVDAEAPAALAVLTRRAVQSAMVHAADEGERETLKIMDLARQATRGNLRVAIEERAFPVFDRALDEQLATLVRDNLDGALKTWAADPRRVASDGPLGIPMPVGPLGGLGKNLGLWLHLAFILLTWHGIDVALYDKIAPAARLQVAMLLLIPLVAIIVSVRDEDSFKLFTYAWMLGCFHLAMNGVTYWLQYGGRADNAGGQGGEANFLGAVIVMVAPIAFSMAINMPGRLERFAGLAFAGIYALGVLASGSRAGLLALIGAMGYWLINTHRKAIAGGLAMMAVAGFLVAAPESFWEKMGTIVGEKDKNPWVENPVEPSKHERLILWDLAIRLWKDHPVWGIGPLNYPRVSAEETDFTDPYMGQRGLQTHNTWLQLLAEYGTVGGIVWAGAFLNGLLSFRAARRRMKGYPGWEWFPAMCLGFESGALASGIVLSFNSFQWYDYIYWHMIFGPIALEVSRSLGARLDWLKPGEQAVELPPARYGPPRPGKLDVASIDLADLAPLAPDVRLGAR